MAGRAASTLPELEYLRWAHARYGRVRIDLASSGVPAADVSLVRPADLSDPWTPRRFEAALAERMGRPETEVLGCHGTSQALWLVCAAALSPRRPRVVIETPRYEPLAAVPRGLGAEVVQVERRFEDAWRWDPARVEAAIDDRTALVMLTRPHNPTGIVDGEATVSRIAELAARAGAMVLVNEIYLDFGEPARRTARAIAPNVIAISSLTKRFGVGWARAGWVLAPTEWRPRLETALRHAMGWAGTGSAALGLAVLAREEQLTRRSNAITGEKRLAVDRWVARETALEWVTPPFGIYGFVRVRRRIAMRRAVEALCDAKGVLVAPGEFFGEPHGFRIGWTPPPTDVTEGLAHLGQAIREAPVLRAPA